MIQLENLGPSLVMNNKPHYSITVEEKASIKRIVENLEYRLIGNQTYDIFSLSKEPDITLEEYLFRIVHYLKFQSSEPIYYIETAYSYIDKLKIDLSLWNIYSIFMTSIVLAIKFSEDSHKDMNFFSRLGGLTVEQLNEYEVELLFKLGFKLFDKRG